RDGGKHVVIHAAGGGAGEHRTDRRPPAAQDRPRRGQRRARAACTRFRKAGSTSAYARVFSPQSGLTHSRSLGTTRNAASSSSPTSSTLGTRGEWMSYIPGPTPRAKPASARSSSTSIRERAASIVVTSASSAS